MGNEERVGCSWCVDAVVVGACVCKHGEWYVGVFLIVLVDARFRNILLVLRLLFSLLLPVHA